MGDTGYFFCLGVAIIAAIAGIVAAHSIVRGTGACGAAIVLAVCANVGFVSTLPFRGTAEMPWLPAAAATVFGSVVLSTILCCLCQIRDRAQSKAG